MFIIQDIKKKYSAKQNNLPSPPPAPYSSQGFKLYLYVVILSAQKLTVRVALIKNRGYKKVRSYYAQHLPVQAWEREAPIQSKFI